MDSTKTKLPIWFWIISVLSLLWFFMDMAGFYSRVFMLDQLADKLPEAQLALYKAMPSWVNVVYGLEVFGGLMGSIALLSKKKWAFILFCISIMGVLSQSVYVWFLSDAIEVMGQPAIVMPIVGIVIGVVMVVFSRAGISKNWLK